MKRHMLSPKYLEVLDFAIFMLKSNLIKVLIATLLIYLVRILYFREAIDFFEQSLPIEYKRLFNDSRFDKNFSQQFTYLMYGKWYNQLSIMHSYWEHTFQIEHKFNFCFLLAVLSLLAIGLESPKSTLIYKFTTNKIFKVVLCLQIVFIIAYFGLSTTVFQKKFENPIHYYPSYRIWLSALAVLLILFAVEELTKRTIRKLYKRDHERLQIFFNTRLGMWSPR